MNESIGHRFISLDGAIPMAALSRGYAPRKVR
jgi:hypothetical protein